MLLAVLPFVNHCREWQTMGTVHASKVYNQEQTCLAGLLRTGHIQTIASRSTHAAISQWYVQIHEIHLLHEVNLTWSCLGMCCIDDQLKEAG